MDYDKTETVTQYFPRPVSNVSVPAEFKAWGSATWTPTPYTDSGNGDAAILTHDQVRRRVGTYRYSEIISKPAFIAHPYLNTGQSMDFGSMLLESPHVTDMWASSFRINGVVRMQGPVVGDSPYPPANLPGNDVNFANLLKTEAVAKGKSGALQMLVSLMEGPKTLQLFGDAAGNLAHLLHVARKRLQGNTKEVKQLLDRMEVHGLQDGVSAYLQWRYGWRILLLEIKAAFEALSAYNSYVADVLHRERAVEELPHLSQTVTTFTHDWSPSLYCGRGPLMPTIYVRRTTKSTKVRGSAVVFFLITEEAYRAKQLNLSFAPTLYELVPYSFVLDWFVNIQDWLAAYASATPGLAWQGGVYSHLALTETIYEPLYGHYGTPSVPLRVVDKANARHSKYRFERSLFNPAEPLPPVLFDGLTLTRAADAVALVTQRMNALTRDAAGWRFKLPRK